jgi:polysaccharide export outer membrane protein
MIAVGGLTDFADGNGATLHASCGRQQAVQRPPERLDSPWRHLGQRGHVKPGDVLIIPQSWF